MFKFNEVNLGGPTPNIQISINEINTTNEVVEIPVLCKERSNNTIRYIGYKEVKTKDTRSDYERWKDEYYYSYYPTPTIIEVEVPVSKNVKKIIIPYSIENISKKAFKNVAQVEFIIDENNYNYKISEGKIIHKHTGEIIWPYSE